MKKVPVILKYIKQIVNTNDIIFTNADKVDIVVAVNREVIFEKLKKSKKNIKMDINNVELLTYEISSSFKIIKSIQLTK